MDKGRLVAEKGTPEIPGGSGPRAGPGVSGPGRFRVPLGARRWPDRRPRSPTWRRRGSVVGQVAAWSLDPGAGPASMSCRRILNRDFAMAHRRETAVKRNWLGMTSLSERPFLPEPSWQEPSWQEPLSGGGFLSPESTDRNGAREIAGPSRLMRRTVE